MGCAKPHGLQTERKPVIAQRAVALIVAVACMMASPVLLFIEQKEEGCATGTIVGNMLSSSFVDFYIEGGLPALFVAPFIAVSIMSAKMLPKLQSSSGVRDRADREASKSMIMVCACFLLLNSVVAGAIVTRKQFGGDELFDIDLSQLLITVAVSFHFRTLILHDGRLSPVYFPHSNFV